MAEVKWIKLACSLGSDAKMREVRRQKNGDSMALLWVLLLCRAGEVNDGGRVYIAPGVPYTTRSLANDLGFPERIVSEALKLFARLGMIETTNGGGVQVVNWEKHQNIITMEKIREQTRQRVAQHRYKNSQCNVTCNVTGNVTDGESETLQVTHGNAREEEGEEEREEDKEFTPAIAVVNSGACARDGGAEKPDFDTLETYASANLQCLTAGNMAELVSFMADLPEDVIRFAIDKANANSVRKWAYVRSILQRWVEAGVKTLGDAKAEAEAKRGKKAEHTRFDYQQRDYKAEDFSRERFNDLERLYGDGGADNASG